MPLTALWISGLPIVVPKMYTTPHTRAHTPEHTHHTTPHLTTPHTRAHTPHLTTPWHSAAKAWLGAERHKAFLSV